MPRFNEIINNFINGEVSPKIYGRMDSEIYKRSCRTLQNMLVHPQGGASRRVGTELSFQEVPAISVGADFISLDEGARIFPFTYSEDEKYLIVFNKDKNSATNENAVAIYRVDTGFFTVHQFTNSPVINYGPANARGGNSLVSTAKTSAGLQTSAVLEELQYIQAGSHMVFVHKDLPPFVVGRNADGGLQYCSYSDNFFSADTEAIGAYPFMDLNLSDVTITAGATTGATTLTASAALFESGHIGAPFAFQDSGVVGMAVVTGYSSSTLVNATVVRTLPSAATSGTTQWYESAWSNVRGWPRSVAYHNGSLYFGGNATFPNRIWKSQTFDIFEMTNTDVLDPGITNEASDPFYGDIAAHEGQAEILWMVSGRRDMLVGTATREYAVPFFEFGNVDVKPQTSNGCEKVQPAIVEDTPVYVQRGYRKLREMLFDDRTQGYASPEITFLAEHMSRKGPQVTVGDGLVPRIKAMAYQALDNSVLWVIDNNGFLFGCTKSRENSVVAFHYHDIGGEVKSIVSVKSRSGESDDVYMLVKREIDGSDVVNVELLRTEFTETSLNPGNANPQDIPVFTDFSKVFRRTDTTNFYASLTKSVDADAADGSVTGTETGTVTYSKAKAQFDGSTYVDYDGTSNADFAQEGCIRFWARGNSTPSGTLFTICKAAADTDNMIKLAGNGALTINDSAGSAIISTTATLGLGLFEYNLIELNYELTTGLTEIFVNGTQVFSDTSTGTRDTSIDLIRIGADENGANQLTGGLYDFQIYDSVQNTNTHNVVDYHGFGTTLYKLDDLEGETVAVTANGNYVGDFTVSGGEIADIGSDYTSSETIVVGLKYTNLLEIQPVDAGSGIGSAMGSVKRIDRAVTRFRDTAAAKIGPDINTLEDIPFRASSTPLTDPIDLVTDDKVVELRGNYDRLARVVISNDAPLPCNVTCISLRGVEGDV